METRLVIETLQDALSTRTAADGLILHSDRGSQYTSKEYNDYLEPVSYTHLDVYKRQIFSITTPPFKLFYHYTSLSGL